MPPEEEWMKAGTQDMHSYRTGKPLSAATVAEEVRPDSETAELLYRSTNEGLISTGYNPWRHTCYVAGRPVQVHFENVGALHIGSPLPR